MRKLGFGLMRLPLTDPEDRKSIDQQTLDRMVDIFMERGFTYFDTAYPYHFGLSEAAARKAVVKRYPRDAFQLADKMPTFSVKDNADYQRIFDEQLERCGVEYFDYYLLHNLGAKNYAETLKHGGFDFMAKVKAEGKARRIGLSFHDKADLLDRILTDHPEMEFVQLQINYIDWENNSIESRKCYEVATKHGKPVIAMEPVKGGSLAVVPDEADRLFKSCRPEMSTASWAVRYAASLENVIVVLSGMSDMEQLLDNTSYMQEMEPLSNTEYGVLNKAVEIINRATAIPCTSCQYCVEGCPQEIPIPRYFALYNNQSMFVMTPALQNYYMNLTQEMGKASECIACRECEQHCPQHIAIAEELEKVAAVFEKAS